MVSLVVSAALAAVGKYFSGLLPALDILDVINILGSLASSQFFCDIFKIFLT